MSYLAKVKVRIEQMMKEQRQIFESYWIILDVVLFKEKYRRIISNTPIVLYYSFSCSCSVTSLLNFFWSWDIRSMQDCFTKFLENNFLIHKYCLCGIQHIYLIFVVRQHQYFNIRNNIRTTILVAYYSEWEDVFVDRVLKAIYLSHCKVVRM